jgi:hypothetical protein
VAGRAETNPADTWAQVGDGTFDFYVIPFGQEKLNRCEVFSVSSGEVLGIRS